MEFQQVEKYRYLKKTDQPYLQELKAYVAGSKFLPKYHIYPESGLMNDPNGLSYFNGKYQVFYQWFPFEPTHGMKHWGHVSSEDLVHWQQEPVALIPDQEYEKNGCYSGNAIEKDGLLYLFYTANYKTEQGKVPKQAVAFMNENGTIQKYENNPIIDGAPLGISGEIRDPFVFARGDSYYMLLGGKSLKNEGVLLLYQSENLLDWHYQGTIDLPIDTGYMLECPSLIEVDGKDVLFLSPMGYQKQGHRYHNRFASIYLIGHLDVETRTFELEALDELDAGFDYYAPQAFYGKEQQPLTLGWFGCGEPEYTIDQEMWKHGLTLPQELSIRDGRLLRYPAQEVEAAFQQQANIHSNHVVGSHYHLHLEAAKQELPLQIEIGNPGDVWKLSIDFMTDVITLNRGLLQEVIDPAYGLSRSTVLSLKEQVIVDVFVDNSFVEIYINGGEKVFTFRAFNLAERHQIQFPPQTQALLAW